MGIFIFTEERASGLTLVAQSRSRWQRLRHLPGTNHLVLVTTSTEGEAKIDPRDLGQLYAHAELAPILDQALDLVDTPPTTRVIPAVDRQSWTLGPASIEEWSAGALRIVRVFTNELDRLALEDAAARGELRRDVPVFLMKRIAADLVGLRRRAMDSRRDALEALANDEDASPAQDELLRLASVAQSAEALRATPTLSWDLRRRLTDLSVACETATTAMSASLTAALLAAQHRTEKAEADRRELIELVQRRLASVAAALVLPSIVVGVAGANFIVPTSADRWWVAVLTAGAAVLAVVAGMTFAAFISTSRPTVLTRAAHFGVAVGALLVLTATALGAKD
jgi:hypothetical protein